MAGRRIDFEFVHQPLCAGKTDTQTFAGGTSVPKSLIHVGDTRAFIVSDNFYPAPSNVRLHG